MLLLTVLAGCGDGIGAIGNKQDFATKQAPLAYKSQGLVLVLAYDERPYILNGDHDPDFVGLQLNNYGIPFSVKTKSGRPFADEMTDAFARSLATGGMGARSIHLPEDADPPPTLAQARATLLKERARRALLVRITEWVSSTYKYTTLEYNLTATVYDADGRALASKQLKGKDELGGQILGAARKARQVSADALPLKIDLLLNAAEIRAAFQS